MKKLLDKLKSPVVIGQIITNIAGIIILLIPEKAELVNQVVILVMFIINTFCGLNNPDDKNNF